MELSPFTLPVEGPSAFTVPDRNTVTGRPGHRPSFSKIKKVTKHLWLLEAKKFLESGHLPEHVQKPTEGRRSLSQVERTPRDIQAQMP